MYEWIVSVATGRVTLMGKLAKSKKNLFLLCLFLSMMIYVSIIYFIGMGLSVDAKLVGYYKSPSYAPDNIESNMNLFNMDEGTAVDIQNNPDNYREYRIEVYIKNTNTTNISNIQVNLSPGAADNVWLCKTGFAEWIINNISPGEEYNGDITILMKIENMSEEDIDAVIKGLIVKLRYSNDHTDPIKLIRRVQNICF